MMGEKSAFPPFMNLLSRNILWRLVDEQLKDEILMGPEFRFLHYISITTKGPRDLTPSFRPSFALVLIVRHVVCND